MGRPDLSGLALASCLPVHLDTPELVTQHPATLEISLVMIRLIDAQKNFGRQTLYDGIDASIVRGERIGLLGKNGSGKSTFFKILMGQEHLDAGSLVRDRKGSIGYLPQE